MLDQLTLAYLLREILPDRTNIKGAPLLGDLALRYAVDVDAYDSFLNPLRRVMCNSGQRRRSPDRMLHQTLSKGWCSDGSGLLLSLIVRPNRRLVEASALFGATENRSACPAQ